VPLYITRASSLVKEPPRIWWVGKPVPRDYTLGDTFEECRFRDVIEVKATDNELNYVLDRFSNIPHCQSYFAIREGVSKSMTWSGDIAMFIYTNLTDH
jgi:hypothetical protein